MAFHNVYQADVKADLYGLSLADGQVVTLFGDTTRGDIFPIVYMWDGSSSAADNFPAVIKPTGQVGNGRYIRQTPDQVKGNWNEATSTALAYIQNKPSIPAAQVNSDWNSGSGVSQILNKPTSMTMNLSAPSAGNSFTSGTAFQPNANGPSFISVQATLGGTVGVTGTVVVALSSTQNGTYTNVSGPIRLLISIGLVTADADSGCVPVPSGYWARITLTGTVTATYSKWNA